MSEESDKPRESSPMAKMAPTAPWVDLLIEKLGVPKEGDEIQMDVIAAVLKTERHSRHYQTIVAAWKRRLFTVHGIVITTELGKYIAATDDGKVIEAIRLKTKAGKTMGKAVAIMNATDERKLTNKTKPAYNEMKMDMAKMQERLMSKVLGLS